LPNDEEVFL